MYSKDVTQSHPTFPRRRISDIDRDQDVFSDTAGRTHRLNTMDWSRPMRGGIRL
jgi:hypothetical protein